MAHLLIFKLFFALCFGEGATKHTAQIYLEDKINSYTLVTRNKFSFILDQFSLGNSNL